MRREHTPYEGDHPTTASGPRAGRTKGRRSLLSRALAVLAAAVVALSATTAVLASTRVSSASAGAAAHSLAAARKPTESGVIVIDWNKTLVKILNTPGAQPATIHPTRSLAILHAAIYDAVVSITHSGTPYLFSINAPHGARADAAAAEAGHDTLAALYPAMASSLDQQLAGELGTIPDGTAKQEGIEVGHLAAMLILGARSNDGSSATPPPLPVSTQPGDFRVMPPFVPAAIFTHWAGVTPFVLKAASQFRPVPPPALSSSAYAQATNEVKSLGAVNSTTRTAEQTTIARFWPGPIWVTWNEIAENSALNHHASLTKAARLFALLNLSFADTTIAMYDAKYTYHFWRPVTAIRAADTGNPDVVSDPAWTPLLTGSDPSYPGAHSAISAAGAAILTSVFGAHDSITVTSDVLPGVVRSFDSYTAAAAEAGLSRIYGGVHTRLDHVAGLKLGQDAAQYVLAQAKTPTFGLRTK